MGAHHTERALSRFVAPVLGVTLIFATLFAMLRTPPIAHPKLTFAAVKTAMNTAEKAEDPHHLNATQMGTLAAQLQKILDGASTDTYGSSWVSAIRIGRSDGDERLSLAAGFSNMQAFVAAKPADMQKYGSSMKMVVAMMVLRLVEEGVFHLEDKPMSLVDLYLERLHANATVKYTWSTMSDLFGSQVMDVTIKQLLQHRSGIPDFDTLAARAVQTSHPTETMDPLTILNQINGLPLDFAPGSCGKYSSTGYVIVGLLLAQYMDTSWQDLDPFDFFPDEMRHKYTSTLVFPSKGECSAIPGMAHGYRQPPPGGYDDVFNWTCTYGWMAGNMVGSAQSLADFVFDLYGPPQAFVNSSSLLNMLEFGVLSCNTGAPDVYGIGTMLMNSYPFLMAPDLLPDGPHFDATGQMQPPELVVGHKAEMFGFYGWSAYYYQYNFSLSVSTNLECEYHTCTPSATTYLSMIAVANQLTYAIQGALGAPAAPGQKASGDAGDINYE